MIFGKSIAIDREGLRDVASATYESHAFAAVEADYIDRLRAGDADAFDSLITRYSGDIYAILFRITENAEEAADLTQETFLSALKAIRTFRGDSELKTWLFRIAVNHSRNRFRWWKRRKRDNTISLDAPIGDSDVTYSDTIASNTISAEDTVLMRERETALRAALMDISEIYREVIVLCDIEGLAYEEIASALDINIGTVKSRIARGRDELRKRLKDL
jgi:RNA polymerase sigma-70 factor (ECF subfamily)